MAIRSTLFVALLLSCQRLLAADAVTECKVVDLMPAFWEALGAKDAAAQMRSAVIDIHPDIYNEKFVSLPTGAQWEEKLARDRAYVEAHRAEVTAAEQYLAANVPRYMKEFGKEFPDYRCDYTFYIAPSFGNMDGAATVVNGQHLIIFAPDVIARLHTLDELKVLIDHEVFHVYHHQATGVLGVEDAAVPTIEMALWSEGLATFVSGRMNPSVSLDIALLQPGIPEGTRPHMTAIAADLLAQLDERDEPTYARYFVGGRQPDGYPGRSGYYVGFVIAERLSKHLTPQKLAHLKGPALHAAIVAELMQLQTNLPN